VGTRGNRFISSPDIPVMFHRLVDIRRPILASIHSNNKPENTARDLLLARPRLVIRLPAHQRLLVNLASSQGSAETLMILMFHSKRRVAGKAAASPGIDFKLARVWPNGDRNFERHLKNMKKACQYCPVCKTERKTHVHTSTLPGTSH